jgi:hypothetical protein
VEEPVGCPGLLEGLTGLREAIERGKLPMKDRLARRAIEEVQAISNGSLDELQGKAKELEEKRHAFADSDVYAKSAKLQEELNEAEKNLDYHRNDMLRIRDDIKREIARAKDFKVRIESEILESFEEKVMLQMEISLEPLLDKTNVA